MESFLNFFETMPIWGKMIWLTSVIAICWILEGYYSLFKFDYKKWGHARTNLVLLVFTITINTIFAMVTVGIFEWQQQHAFGLLYLIKLPIWVELLIALLVLDLIAQYFVHYLLHKNKWMWRLHTVHHSDTKVDVTTGTRHHPLDFLFRELFALIAILIMGMPIAFYLFYRIITIFFTYFTHANLGMPKKLDLALSYVIVTPNMHKFHHHREMPWTDTNFGGIFSVWDRIFGTFIYDDISQIKYGLDITESTKDEDFWYQINLPFNRNIKYKE